MHLLSSTFIKVENPSSLIPVVKQRLPESCFIFNQLHVYDRMKDDMDIFTFGSGSDIWIITKYIRDDYGTAISISAPDSFNGSTQVREYLVTSGLIDWNKPFIFNAVQNNVTKMIVDINIEEFGQIIAIHPTHLFHMTPSDALKINISELLEDNSRLKRLSIDSGTSFIADNWKYAIKDKTKIFVRKSVENFVSGGLYKENGELVAGAITPPLGLISMLHTDPKHRRKGYASKVMRFLFRELAQEGLEPCLTSEIDNLGAVNFHMSLGLKPVGRVNFILKH